MTDARTHTHARPAAACWPASGAVAGATAVGGRHGGGRRGDRGGGGLASDDWPSGPGAWHSPAAGRTPSCAASSRRSTPTASRRTSASWRRSAPATHCRRQDRPGAWHRRGARLDRGGDDEVRRGVRRADDRRGAVVHPGAGVAAIPVDTKISNVDRDAEGRRERRPDLRRQRALRLAGHRRHERHRRRTGRRRRRVGRGRLDGARAGDGHPPHRRDDRLRGGRGRGAGPLRLDPHGQPVQVRRRERRGHVHQRHRRQQPRPTTARATATACGCSPRARRPARTPRHMRCGSPWAARTTRPRATSPVSWPRSPGRRPPAWTSG